MPTPDEILQCTRELVDDYALDQAVRLGVDIFSRARVGHGTRGYAKNHYGLEIAWWIHPDRYVKEMDFILQHFNLKGTERILSLGCGPAFHELVLAKCFPGLSILATDFDPKEIATATHIAKTLGVSNVTFKRLNAEHVDEIKQKGPFDRVMSIAALHDVPNLTKAFRMLVTVLKKDALFILTHNPHRRAAELANEAPLEETLAHYFEIKTRVPLITPQDAENYYGEIAKKSLKKRGYALEWDAIVATPKTT